MKSGNGSIVNISSIDELQGFGLMSSYNASKYGVRGLTKSAAIDLGPFNVRVNSIHSGLIKRPMTEGADQSQQHVAMERGGGETAGLAQNAVFH